MADLIRWDPFREMVSLRDAMDRLFEESFVRPFGRSPLLGTGPQTLALDVYETDDDLVVETSLPGINPDQVDISVVGNTLTISGEVKHEEEKEEKGRYHYRERRYGAFRRSVALPVEVNADAAEATFKNGELRLVLPKVEAVKPKRIEVKVK
ncbi:MAG: Hsp20/alpha crystallin family protein [Dehalococcoidia bacterium]